MNKGFTTYTFALAAAAIAVAGGIVVFVYKGLGDEPNSHIPPLKNDFAIIQQMVDEGKEDAQKRNDLTLAQLEEKVRAIHEKNPCDLTMNDLSIVMFYASQGLKLGEDRIFKDMWALAQDIMLANYQDEIFGMGPAGVDLDRGEPELIAEIQTDREWGTDYMQENMTDAYPRAKLTEIAQKMGFEHANRQTLSGEFLIAPRCINLWNVDIEARLVSDDHMGHTLQFTNTARVPQVPMYKSKGSFSLPVYVKTHSATGEFSVNKATYNDGGGTIPGKIYGLPKWSISIENNDTNTTIWKDELLIKAKGDFGNLTDVSVKYSDGVTEPVFGDVEAFSNLNFRIPLWRFYRKSPFKIKGRVNQGNDNKNVVAVELQFTLARRVPKSEADL